MAEVLVVGSVAFDSVETPFGKVENVLGGAASYFGLAARLFAPVRLVATVGSDFPEEFVGWFTARGIDVAGLERRSDGKTFRWIGDYGYDLNVAHTVDTQLNVFADFRPQLPEHYRDTPFVYLANILPSLQLDVLSQMRGARFVGLDSMNFWIENPQTRAVLAQVVERVDAVFMSDTELRQYTGTFNLIAAGRSILDRGPRVVLIKKGEHGAIALSAEGVFVTSAFPLDSPRDPTGAGDSFAGGLMGYLAATGDVTWPGIKRAMAYGSVIASFAVEDFSVGRLLTLTIDEVRQRYAHLRDLTTLEAQMSELSS